MHNYWGNFRIGEPVMNQKFSKPKKIIFGHIGIRVVDLLKSHTQLFQAVIAIEISREPPLDSCVIT